MHPMTIKFSEDSSTFKDGNNIRTLKCPKERKDQINQKYYNFKKETMLRYGMRSFRQMEETKTNSDLARRLWNSLWIEGWREK